MKESSDAALDQSNLAGYGRKFAYTENTLNRIDRRIPKTFFESEASKEISPIIALPKPNDSLYLKY